MVKFFPWKTMNPIGEVCLYDTRGNAFARRCNWEKMAFLIMVAEA